MDDTNDTETVEQLVTQICEQLLVQVRDGDKLISVTYHYPKGLAAINYGWQLGVGLASGVSMMIFLGAGLHWLLS